MTHYIVQTFGLKGEDLQRAREQLVETRLKTFITGFDELLRRGGGEYFANNALTMADLKMFVQISGLTSGRPNRTTSTCTIIASTSGCGI